MSDLRGTRRHALAAASLTLCGLGSGLAAAADREWYTLSIDGQRVGYAWHETRTAAAGERIDSQVMRVQVSQLQHSSLVETVTEVGRNAPGAPKWIRVRVVNGADRSGWNATVADDARSMMVATAGTRATRRMALPANLLWPDQLPGALGQLLPGNATRARFQLLDTASASAVEAEVERVADADATGGTRMRITASVAGNRPRVESFWLDARSRIARRERIFFASPLRWDACDRNCDASVVRPFDLMARLVVASPFRIPQAALAGPIRYVISRADGVVPRLPATSEQSVVVDGSKSVVTICATCGESVQLTDAERASYLASNAWVQSDAAEVQSFARRNSGKGMPRKVMAELVEAVRNHMTGEVDYLGYASATQALATRSGDCTEYSVLLAAAARARGIPTRIVVGLAYAGRFSGKKDVFSPHTWVQAWTGDRWVSYDAGLEKFDATHIALAVGDGDPRNTDANAGTSGQWRIEKLGLVK